ncbi:hypothetical protein Hanom_Chr01g00093931 [Helianthus anomalus]
MLMQQMENAPGGCLNVTVELAMGAGRGNWGTATDEIAVKPLEF